MSQKRPPRSSKSSPNFKIELRTSRTLFPSPKVELNELELLKSRTFRTRTQVRSITSDGSGPKNTDLGWAGDGPGLKPFHESCARALDKPLNSLIKMLRLLGPFPKVGLGLFQF